MPITLYHHPHSRAATVVWMLEECGQPYTLSPVDLKAGEQKSDAFLALNRMGKLPVLDDDGVIVTESAAIGMYLADRYAHGRLSPAIDDPRRGPYLKWCFFAPTVIEVGCLAKAADWKFRASSAGFGDYETMLDTVEEGLAGGPWLLGDTFTMADVIVGGPLEWMLQFGMIERRARFTDYVERLLERPAKQRAIERNAAAAS